MAEEGRLYRHADERWEVQVSLIVQEAGVQVAASGVSHRQWLHG